MIFYYIRHGDPTYVPDALTPLGKRQAEAVAKRLALHGVDEIYSSTSTRAYETAQPTCEILKKECTKLDWALESHAWKEFTVEQNGKTMWMFDSAEVREVLARDEVINLGFNWYEHPEFTKQKAGMERIKKEADAFFMSYGYEHIGNSGRYKVLEHSDKRVALFAHAGFGMAFLSIVLGIPYPVFSNHFNMCHTGVTAIEFQEYGGYAVPRVLTLSSEAHIYREGLPTHYNNRTYF